VVQTKLIKKGVNIMRFPLSLAQLKPAKVGWGTVAGWLGAFVSFPIAGLVGQAVVGSVDNVTEGFIGGAATGAVIGLGQWLVLSRTHQIKVWWIVASTIGLSLGLGAGVALFGAGTSLGEIIPRALTTGGLFGLAQAVAFNRGFKTLSLWSIVVTYTFTLSWIITSGVIGNSVSNSFTIFGASGAIFFQVVTGLILLLFVPQTIAAQSKE
jgi:hypothetical protein